MKALSLKRLVKDECMDGRDDKMSLKRKSKIYEVTNVWFMNGFVSLGGVSLNVHCFEVDGVLIDTGSQSLDKELRHFFSETDIDQVLITHDHEDHTGGAAYLQKEYNLPINIHSTRVDHCTKKADYPFYRKLFWGKDALFKQNQSVKHFIPEMPCGMSSKHQGIRKIICHF